MANTGMRQEIFEAMWLSRTSQKILAHEKKVGLQYQTYLYTFVIYMWTIGSSTLLFANLHMISIGPYSFL